MKCFNVVRHIIHVQRQFSAGVVSSLSHNNCKWKNLQFFATVLQHKTPLVPETESHTRGVEILMCGFELNSPIRFVHIHFYIRGVPLFASCPWVMLWCILPHKSLKNTKDSWKKNMKNEKYDASRWRVLLLFCVDAATAVVAYMFCRCQVRAHYSN